MKKRKISSSGYNKIKPQVGYEKENLILVRGVANKTIISDFIIMSDNQNLIILHKDSIKTEKLYKFPIVISVNIIPKEVYSFCVTTN